MFGKYKHTLDPKGRLFVPAKLREELGSAFYVARSLDPCLTVYTEVNVRCEPDKQGRILLPAELRGYAGLKDSAVILGFGDKAEIWDADTYDAMEQAFFAEGDLDTVLSALEL